MKEQVAGASRFLINGKEFFVRHNFTFGEDVTNIFETTSGAFIHPNGEPVKDRYLLDQLPEQHKGRAFLWWDRTFGVVGAEAQTLVDAKEEPEAGREMTKKEILAEVRAMQARIEMLTAMAVEMEDEPPQTVAAARKEGEDLKEPEPQKTKEQTRVAAGKGAKAPKEKSVLTQMGISG